MVISDNNWLWKPDKPTRSALRRGEKALKKQRDERSKELKVSSHLAKPSGNRN